MYNKKDIIKTLNEYNYFIEEQVLESFIKNWKIDPIYEDEDGVEFFDNLSIIKLKKGISLKSQGYSNDEIIYHINKILAETTPPQEQKVEEKVAPVVEQKAEADVESEAKPNEVLNVVENQVEPISGQQADIKNVTVDITSQTLQMLADAVAGKITNEIRQQLQGSEFMQPLLLDNPYKEKNDELTKQVEELMQDNKKMAARIEVLEGNRFCFLTWLENLIASLKK